jgi:competence transcription factor ComK
MNTWVRIMSDAGNILYWINTNNVTKVARYGPKKCLVHMVDKTSLMLDMSVDDFRKATLAAG